MEQWPILKFFEYNHLPTHLQVISAPFHELAHDFVAGPIEDYGEASKALDKLLEAKDCAVRAVLK